MDYRIAYLAFILLPTCGGLATSPLPGVDAGAVDVVFHPDATAGIDATRDANLSFVDQLARECTLAASCAGTGNASVCARGYTDSPTALASRFQSCAHVTDCDALAKCLGGNLLTDPGSMCNDTAHCEGARLVSDANASLTFDCAGSGLLCEARDHGGSCCAPSSCTTPSCSNTVLLHCDDGVTTPFDCGSLGETCANSNCLGTGAPCTSEALSGSCNGSIATTCVGGFTATLDCSQNTVNTQCSSGQCIPPVDSNPQCLSGNTMCDGTRLLVCAADTWHAVECGDIGFRTCSGDFASAVCVH